MTIDQTAAATAASTIVEITANRERTAQDLAQAQRRRTAAAESLRAHDKTFGAATRIIDAKRAAKVERLQTCAAQIAEFEQAVRDTDERIARIAGHGESP